MKIKFKKIKVFYPMYCLEIKIGNFFRTINLSKHIRKDGKGKYGFTILPF